MPTRNVFDFQNSGRVHLRHCDFDPPYFSKPKLIRGWYHIHELCDHELYDMLGVLYDQSDTTEQECENITTHFERQNFFRFSGLKVGGVGNSCQGTSYTTDFIHNIYATKYGDSGSLHISETSALRGDMCEFFHALCLLKISADEFTCQSQIMLYRVNNF